MAKFNILTSMLLNVGGFKDGVNAAKKSTKEMKDALDNAGKEIGGIMGKVGDSVKDVAGDVGNIGGIALKGVDAFRKFIPAIKGVKTALIASGIGAIVVAIGVAFATLNSYLKGTQDGADRLNRFMGYLKGGFEAVIKRVQTFGEGVALIFDGKFREGARTMKEAFSGGLFNEINEKAKENVGLAERENQLWKRKNDFIYLEADLLEKQAEARLKANDKENYSLEERRKFAQEALDIETRLSNERNGIATEEYNIIKERNALGNTSREDAEKEAQAYRDMQQTITQSNNTKREMVGTVNAISGELRNQIGSIEEEIDLTEELKKETEKYNQALIEGDKEAALASYRRIDAINIEIERIKKQKEELQKLIEEQYRYEKWLQENNEKEPQKLTRATSLPGTVTTTSPSTTGSTVEPVDYSAWGKLNEVMGETLSIMSLVNLATDGLNAAFNSLFSESSSSMKDFIGGLLKMVQGLFASTLAAQFMAYASSPQNVATGGLWLLGGATAGLAAVSAMWDNLIPEFATGGIITGPTLGVMGEYPGVKNNPEVIAPLSKLTDLIGGKDGNVRFRIERDALIGIENSHKKELIYF